ncbi:hydroxyacid dehydrogenase [Aureimonas phyllosphaerae]|uniref:Phosphoglycerate dehydrogenase-like enzyme n=1 Tax=Aureimonas phyllosphaerae TaxID=1166078 RepID=A0A7W6BY63_9HYPH|nr:hydroxyacid dehydrogenase [Aureimonas phyllosphaerae]MBB3934917.1 phosphoglycerate dehydrogenase-like enzyme [Aureimonas phyllosphaerae]MBB3958925.1 phosphoglycerate dehydrogenase-like enzyme [Aureimonas phyllosphaerae]SFF40687.1 Phosphoglycerate dehydrogenase [Aureimonas phyllosphaerae]
MSERPLVIVAPHPRDLDMIFTLDALSEFRERYELVETTSGEIDALPTDVLARARYLVGQPDISDALLAAMTNLRAIVNVEGNFTDNMPYATCFERGIHVLITSSVFAEPVAEMGLGMALSLHRQIAKADADFRRGEEVWGLDGNGSAQLLTGSRIGIVGFGDLGRCLNRLLAGFRAKVRVYDPWLPASTITDHGAKATALDDILAKSDTVFVTASVTADNQHLFDARAFASMKPGAAFVLLSRAGIVDFDAMREAAASGHIKVATDVFPEEPPAADDPVRSTPNMILSAHRAGALDRVFKRMGDILLDDLELMDAGLPPVRARRAERETVRRMRSKPVSKS